MRVLDLFAGLGGWSTPFAERGHEVVTVDIEERFGCTYTADVREWTQGMGSPEERAKIPSELALDVCLAAERDLAADRRAADYTGRLFA